jgi:hypothetical protein
MQILCLGGLVVAGAIWVYCVQKFNLDEPVDHDVDRHFW